MVVGGGSKDGRMWAGPLSWDSPRRPSWEELDTFCCTQRERNSGQHTWLGAPLSHTHTHTSPLFPAPFAGDSTRVPAQQGKGHKGTHCICTVFSHSKLNVNTWPGSPQNQTRARDSPLRRRQSQVGWEVLRAGWISVHTHSSTVREP